MDRETLACYISLGSNLGDGRANLEEALGRLTVFGQDLLVEAMSAVYETEPQGLRDQP